MTAPSCVIPLVSVSEFFRGLPRCFFSFCILFSPLCFIGISHNKGLGDFPQQAYVFLTFCGTKYICLLFLSHCRAFFCLSIFPLLRFSLFYSEFFTDILSVILSSRLSVRCFLRINLFYLFSAQLLRSLGGSFMKMELLF